MTQEAPALASEPETVAPIPDAVPVPAVDDSSEDDEEEDEEDEDDESEDEPAF